MRALALVALAALLSGCAIGSSCEPHDCAPDEICDPTDPSETGGYESCSGVYLGVRASTTLAGAWNPEAARDALVAQGFEASVDERDGGVGTARTEEQVFVSERGDGTVQWTWLHDPDRRRSGVSAQESLRLMEEDRMRLDPRAEEVLGAFENATGLARTGPLRWDPQVGIS